MKSVLEGNKEIIEQSEDKIKEIRQSIGEIEAEERSLELEIEEKKQEIKELTARYLKNKKKCLVDIVENLKLWGKETDSAETALEYRVNQNG